MTRGILYIAFGSEYDKLTAHTVAFSRKYTDLPICILTNIEENNRHPKWKEITNIEFKFFRLHQDKNRSVKTMMNEYTPYDETLYLDCDSVIRNPGIEKAFDKLHCTASIVLNQCLYWDKGDKLVRLYKKTLLNIGLDLPLAVYNGAFICFKKNEWINRFFSCWNTYWQRMGCGREMPSLACAVKKVVGLEVSRLEKGFFTADTYDPNCIVQHNYNSSCGMDFWEEFKLPRIKQNKPFDKAGSGDWNWVRMDDE